MTYPIPHQAGYFGAVSVPVGASLWRGMTGGEHVRQWQLFLLNQGLSVGGTGPDGKYGPATETGTRGFQLRHGLEPTGFLDGPTAALAATLGYGTIPQTERALPDLSKAPGAAPPKKKISTEAKAAIGLSLIGLGLIGWGSVR